MMVRAVCVGLAVILGTISAQAKPNNDNKYWVQNQISGVVLCFNSFNSGSNPLLNDNNDLVYNQNFLYLYTGSPSYWSGVNYDMRDASCTPLCSNTCTYLGNINITASSTGVSYTGGSSSSALTGLGLTNSSHTYYLNGSYVPTVPPKDQTVTNGTHYLLCDGTTSSGSNPVTYSSSDKKSKRPAGVLFNGDSVTLPVGQPSYYSSVSFSVRQGPGLDACKTTGTSNTYDGSINFSTTTSNNIASVLLTATGPVNNTTTMPTATITMAGTCDPYSGSGAGYGCTLDNLIFTPPAQVPVPTPKTYQNNPGILYRGVNLSGSEFGNYLSIGNIPYPSELPYYINKGMNTVRLPIRWAYAQPQGPDKGPLNQNYMKFIGNILENLTQSGVHVIVDLHDYQRYAYQGEPIGVPPNKPTGSAPNGQINTPQQLAGIWTSLIQAFQQDPKINMDNLIFDISNEPSQMDTQQILTNENAAIAAIRSAGAKGLILVEGNMFSGMWAWENTSTYNNGANTASSSASVFLPSAIVDPGNNYAINVHQYFDSNGSMSGTTQNCIPANNLLTQINASSFLSWVNDNKVKVFVTEFGVGRGTNKKEEANCMANLKVFIDWMQKNAYTSSTGGFIGWTMWGAGHAWGGYNTQGQPSYVLDVSPYYKSSSQVIDSPQIDTLEKFNFLT